MALANNDNFLQFGEEAKSMQKVLEWLASVPDVATDNSAAFNSNVLLKTVGSNLNKSITVFSTSESNCSSDVVLKNTKPVGKQRQGLQTVNEETFIELLNSEHSLAIQKWTLSKKSSSTLELKGELMSVSNKKIIDRNFSAGMVLTRPQPFCVRTTKGVFALIGKLQDLNNEIPAQVKKHFIKNFPTNWKKIVREHWNISINDSKSKNSSEDSIDKSKLQSTNNTTTSINISKDESTVCQANKKWIRRKIDSSIDNTLSFLNSKDSSLSFENKKKAQKNIDSGVGTCESDDACFIGNKRKTKRCNNKENNIYLKNWTLVKDSERVLLNGFMFSPDADKLSDDLFLAGEVVSVKRSGIIVTSLGSFILVGNIHDPEKLIPDLVKKSFCNGFPKSWKSIVDKHWSSKNTSSNSEKFKRKGKKRANNEDISPPPKLPKVAVEDVQSNVRKNLKSKISVKAGKNIKSTAKKNHEESPKADSKQLDGKTIRTVKRNLKKDEDDSISTLMNDTNSPEKLPSRRKKGKAEKANTRGKNDDKLKTKVNQKRQSLVVSKKGLSCGPSNKRKINNKKGQKKEDVNTQLLGTNMSGFSGLSNKSDFFKQFDNDFMDEIGSQSSFKEASLGGCLRSAERKSKGKNIGKETPLSKHVADVFSHSSISNRSGHSQSVHSAHSSPDTKRNDVAKRIQKINKVKKTAGRPAKNQRTKNKYSGNAEVNAIYKQMTKSPSVLSSTPRIIKKIFRSKALRDDFENGDDDSIVMDSSANITDSENDFL